MAGRHANELLPGMRFGRLTIIERAGSRRDHANWKCLCRCGKAIEVVSDDLMRGRTRPCGCGSKRSVFAQWLAQQRKAVLPR